LKFQAVADKTAKHTRGLLYFAAPGSSNKHCAAVYMPISTLFSAFFLQVIALSDVLHSTIVLVFVARWRHNSEIAVKNCEKSKIGGKVCAHHFV